MQPTRTLAIQARARANLKIANGQRYQIAGSSGAQIKFTSLFKDATGTFYLVENPTNAPVIVEVYPA